LISRLFRAAEKRWRVAVPVTLIVVAVFAFLVGLLVKALWNWLMPDIFGLATITVWQALGLLLLAKILVSPSGDHSRNSRRHDDRRPERTRPDTDSHDADSDRSQEQLEHPEQLDVDEKRTAEFERYWREEGGQAYQRWLKRVLEEKKGGGDGGQ
jgi:hypothetical protein